MNIRTIRDLHAWYEYAVETFGDPSLPVCTLIFRYVDDLPSHRGEELAWGVVEGEVCLSLAHGKVWPLPIVAGKGQISDAGELVSFGAEPLAPGVSIVDPSLNMPEMLHGFVILCGVPPVAPWDARSIIIASTLPPPSAVGAGGIIRGF